VVFQAIRAIPRGRVAAYGEVAARAGLPGRARLVGRLLRESPRSARLPWHRVLRADGRPAFPADSEQAREQLKRLAAEGVEPAGGRIPARYFAWRSVDIDEALWGPR
ncbi:MAG: MGMT family protein, partial [Proteobacteria bacterium]|nr:MGMT family protein [Pseudomonadota bacterium]